MRITKGFSTHKLFADNQRGAVNEIGEISTNSLTFCKDKGIYTGKTTPDITFWSFLNSVDGTDQVLSPNVRDQILTISDWVYTNSINKAVEIYADEVLRSLLTTFKAEAYDFRCGNIVYDGKYWIPEWVSWIDKADNGDVKVWFSDQSFEAQYDEFQIVVIPPITNLDDFFKKSNFVADVVAKRKHADAIRIIQETRGNTPETILWAESYNYVDPIISGNLIPTNWTVLIYGPAGNNIDSIKDALQKHILANSTHTREEWVKILPDIFKRTEFMVIPWWNKVAIPFRTTADGIYSPFVDHADVSDYILNNAPGYAKPHIDTYAQNLSYNYRSLSLAFIGSNENRDNLFKITNVYPDFIAVPSTSLDFNRMSEATRDWSERLLQLIMVAETVGKYTTLPKGITRVTRNDKLYVVANVGNIHYLVAARANFPKE